jgi:diacylglycerol kinase
LVWKHKNIKESFLGALKGLKTVLKIERNARIIFFIGLIVIVLGFLFKLSLIEFAILIIVIIGVFVCEVFNTLVENILDIIQPQNDPQIKILKDISSAAVLLSSLGAGIIGLIIFLPKIIALLVK